MTTARLPALDAMRGLVMVLMAVDHVDAVVNPRHSMADRAGMPAPWPLPAPDFLTRWCTHLCAPTFVFLAGAGVALAAARCESRPAAAAAFDRFVGRRAAVLLGIEVLVLSAGFRAMTPGAALLGPLPVLLQVLYALGTGLALLIPLRRLPEAARLAAAVLLVVLTELGSSPNRPAGLGELLTLRPGSWPSPADARITVLYPAMAWLPAMLFGHAVGERLARGRWPMRAWVRSGAAALLAFLLLRAVDGPGNAHLHRRGDWLLEWLRCSKYPPSAAFLAMTLGLMALVIAALSRARPGRGMGFLVTLGQVPLFFYVLHLGVIAGLAAAGALPAGRGTWVWSWVGAAAIALGVWPLCRWYRGVRQSGRWRWTRYF